MLNKIEFIYLSILRIVVMIVATVFLLSSIILGINGLKAFLKEPEKLILPQLSYSEIINSILQPQQENKVYKTGEMQKQSESISEEDLIKGYVEKIAELIYDFIKKYSVNTFVLDKESFKYKFEESLNQTLDKKDYKISYLKGLSETLAKAVTDKRFIELAQNTSANNAIDNLIMNYHVKYMSEMKQSEEKYRKELEIFQNNKQKSLYSLYLCGGMFFGFLIIVFLAVFLRIEINLRNLERFNHKLGE